MAGDDANHVPACGELCLAIFDGIVAIGRADHCPAGHFAVRRMT